jgi:predicted transcriptional regulator
VTKPDLVESLPVSRSTVDRAVRDLRDLSLVARRDGTFEATLPGRLTWRAYRRFRRRVAAVTDARDLLVHLDPDCGLETRALVGATVHVAEGPAPYRPTEVLEDLIADARRIRGLSTSITDSSSSRLVHEAVVDGGTEYEAVFAADVARFIREEHHERRREMVETGRFEAYRTESLPFGLFLFTLADGRDAAATGGDHDGGDDGDHDGGDDGDHDGGGETDATPSPAGTREVATVVVYDEDTDLRGVLVNDSEAAVRWAESCYRGVRRDAERITDWFRESP